MGFAGEDNQKRSRRAHCVIFPYPTPSHINPMLQFAKRLAKHHVKITFLLSNYLAKHTDFAATFTFPLNMETYSDGYDDGIPAGQTYETTAARFHQFAPPTVKDVIRRLEAAGDPVGCLVYDSFMIWSLDVAKEFRLTAAPFFTQACSVNRIYHGISKGDLTVPLPPGEKISIPGLPALEPRDMPSFITEYESYPTFFKSAIAQFRGVENAHWLLFNTFYELEEEVVDYIAKHLPVKTVGPGIPSMFLDKRLPNDRRYEVSPNSNSAACLEWLNQRGRGTVVYVSFGSLLQLGEAQMEELAWGLKLSNKNFLWVVLSWEKSNSKKLPEDFMRETSGKGLIVPWCHQLEVLSHEAVGCFVTHCGWNSTLEAMSQGVPMVAVPQCSDGPANAKFVADVWKVGIRATAGEDGVVGRETIERCVKEIMEGERGKEIRRNAASWKERAKAAMDDGGSSDRNIQDFVGSAFGSVSVTS